MRNQQRELTDEDITVGDADLDSLFSCLASNTRRQLLGILYEQAPTAQTQHTLSTALASADHENPQERDASETDQHALIDLQHTHLPKLDAAGLIERETSQGAIAIADHPAFADTGVVDAISDETDADSDSLDALFAALADPRRRTILDVLSHQFGPVHSETLARELGATERKLSESAVSNETVEEILIALHHVHLPTLMEAGLVEYDATEGTVAYEGHPDLRVPWTHSVLEPAFRPSLTGESEPGGVGEIEGRKNVVSFGQSLCDRADEELFCLFTDTDLLEAGCFTRIRDAARRGVDVYLGTHDPTVQAYIRENAPEVHLWEPTTDWLNVPIADGRVGRLVFVDRDAVMLGTLLDETDDDVVDEQAIIGEGTGNTLVTMLSQLLTPHLEQIDAKSDAIEFQLQR